MDSKKLSGDFSWRDISKSTLSVFVLVGGGVLGHVWIVNLWLVMCTKFDFVLFWGKNSHRGIFVLWFWRYDCGCKNMCLKCKSKVKKCFWDLELFYFREKVEMRWWEVKVGFWIKSRIFWHGRNFYGTWVLFFMLYGPSSPGTYGISSIL